MKKVFCVMFALLMCVAMAANVLAAEGEFVPSISYKDAPTLLSAELDGEDVDLCLVVTSILDAVNESTDILDDDRALLLSIYEQLLNGTMKLPLENDYVIRDLVDVSLTKTCVTSEDDHQEKLEKADTAMEVVFNLGSTSLTGLVVMHYDEGEWKPVEFKNNGDGTITCWFEDFCPVVFAVESEGPDVPITADSMTAVMWVGILAVSAAAVVVIVANRRKIFG